jgi:GNAT superfamily N-acetyltransferase
MHEDMDTTVLDNGYQVHVVMRNCQSMNDDGNWRTYKIAKHWWLTHHGTPVAFLSTLRDLYGTPPEYAFALCDIEVRDTHRSQGLTRRLVAAAETIESATLYTSGGFTPLGSKALSWLPVYPWETAGVRYNDMAFVEDWDTLRSRFPL